ncbi:hypothetical protein [Thiorhodococcus drewsii]|uniref:hypothetical protein n=1 Tax=Thiorhodococcus drewsii TaxID=210408 RepID=UPI00059275B6|nr:hypothetical protein [Thiorhodococcus drewsii]
MFGERADAWSQLRWATAVGFLRRSHLVGDLAGRHVVRFGLEARAGPRNEAGDLASGRQLDTDIDTAVGGNLVASIEHCTER